MIDYRDRIEANPKIMLGKPVVKGTRITVELILNKIAGGYEFKEIFEMYPHITFDDILAAIGYAAAMVETEEVIVSP
ncbi:MAG: DUF433 domain-containing protein [Haliscomenobacter sp.]|nr:DUF433 domain-containing protein [Haliscomenobacter sp.]